MLCRHVRTLALSVVLGCASVACGGGQGSNATAQLEDIERLIAPSEEGDFAALVAEGDAAFARRADGAEVQRAIAAWEKATKVPTPADMDRRAAMAQVYTRLSRAYYWYAEGHTRWTDGETGPASVASYEKGMIYGERAIALSNDEWRKATVFYGTPVPEAVKLLTRNDTTAVYWYATNAGRWALATSIAEVLSRKDDIYAMMARAAELDRGLFYNAPDRYFGVYFTKIPFGNPALDKSKSHFEAGIAAHPEYLDTKVLMAVELAPKLKDRALAESLLQSVVAFDLSTAPEVRPENENAQRKAQAALKELDELFY